MLVDIHGPSSVSDHTGSLPQNRWSLVSQDETRPEKKIILELEAYKESPIPPYNSTMLTPNQCLCELHCHLESSGQMDKEGCLSGDKSVSKTAVCADFIRWNLILLLL